MRNSAPRRDLERSVSIWAEGVELRGDLVIPAGATGIVVFAHGSGSSRLSPRNRLVAHELQRAGLATLLFDLLTPAEEAIDSETAELRFDIPFLATRLRGATDWLERQPETGALAVGYFGASTGAAAALVAAADRAHVVKAVVSRGGRPDLAAPSLEQVRAPVLLIVGEYDDPVIDWNREALERLRVEKRLEVVREATHLFEEPGALEAVAKLAAAWFARHLGVAAAPRAAFRGEL